MEDTTSIPATTHVIPAQLPASAQIEDDGAPLSAQPQSHLYFPALDGLRFLAVTMVFFYHYAHLPLGWTGVDIFFVLSGFLITGILWDTRETRHRWRNFYARRALRIFPLYYGLLLFFVLTIPLVHWQWHWSQLFYFVYLQNFVRFLPHLGYEPENLLPTTLGHLWSLAIEEQFYLLWPLLVFRARSLDRLLRISWSIVAGCLLLRIGLQMTLPHAMLDNYFLYRCTFTRIDTLVLGGIGALALRSTQSEAAVRRLLRFAWLSGGALALVLVLARGSLRYPGMQTIGFTAIAAVSLGVVLLAVRPTMVARIFSQTLLRRLGGYAYGIYIFHLLVTFPVHTWTARHPHWLALPADILVYIIIILVAMASYHFYEAPFLRLKRHFVR